MATKKIILQSIENQIEPSFEEPDSGTTTKASIIAPENAERLDSDAQTKIGSEIAAIFKNNNVHPVVIFGSRSSGKTSFIVSLLSYIQTANGSRVTIEIDQSIFPENSDVNWVNIVSNGAKIFYQRVRQWINGEAPPATLDEEPFFIPVIITLPSGESTRFAFLEGRGEWYQPDEDKMEQGQRPYRSFKGMIRAFLQNYNDPLTAIYVAPFTTTGGDGSSIDSPQSSLIKLTDHGLVGAIEEYISARRATYHHDNHLMMMTKWDIRCGSISHDEFIDPEEEVLKDELAERYPLSFLRFNNTSMSGNEHLKRISPFCSGVIDRNRLVMPAGVDRERVEYYQRKLWDWLYYNHTGKPLYDDVRPKNKNFLDWILDWLRG